MNLIAILGVFLILHAGFWYMKTIKVGKSLGEDLNGIPLDILSELVAGVVLSYLYLMTKISLKNIKSGKSKYTYDSTFSRYNFKAYRSKRAYFVRSMTFNEEKNQKSIRFSQSF